MNIQQLVSDEYDRIVNTPLISISQDKQEITDFIELVAEHFKGRNTLKICEIGLLRCGNFCLMAECLEKLGFKIKMVGVDLPIARHWEKSAEHKNYKVTDMPHLLGAKFEYEIILGSSQDVDVINAVHDHSEFDIMFIDGKHTGDWPQRDYDAYEDLVPEGGMVVFHDIRESPQGAFRVKRAWERNKNKGSKHYEFAHHKQQKGIGVLIK